MKEIEAHFLEIDPGEIENKLIAMGGQKVQDCVITDKIYSLDGWSTTKKRARLRSDGKNFELTYKEQNTFNVLGGTEEIETGTSDIEAMEEILFKLGLNLTRTAEKRRIRYVFNGVKFDIEFWPKLKPLLEIEADSGDKVKEGAQRLGLDWEEACFYDMKEIYEKVYDMPLDNIRLLTFNRVE